MSKGLEALKRIKSRYNDRVCIDILEDFDIIEKALKRLEELEKAFVALSKDDEKTKKLLSKEIEKNRALEIIKEKGVNVGYFIFRLVHNDLSYEEYIEEQETPYLDIYVSRKKLTKKEYNLLKEVLL